MTVNINSKELLAKLLATENIDIVQANVKTASFNVKDRILTLPLWEDMRDFTYDHLVGHEVGHAIWTDGNKWLDEVKEHGKNFQSFLNVVEDARIEKLIQRKYPGLRSPFIKSYKKMLADGFFGKNQDEINTYKLIDRLNVLFKCGQTVGVKFENDEKVWIDKMSKLETFDEAIALAHELFTKAKEEKEQEQEAMTDMMQQMASGESEEDGEDFEYDDDYDDENYTDGSGNSESIDDEDSDEEDGEETSDNGKSENQETSEDDTVEDETKNGSAFDKVGGNDTQLDPDEPLAESDTALEENIEAEFGKVNDQLTIKNVKLDLDEKRLLDRVFSYKDIINDFSSDNNQDAIKAGQTMYKDFLVNNKKTINYLVKEFEMKKKASEYKRATVSKTGVIDTLKMNNYKFTDDIFKKMTIVPDGKNHGLVMFIDWSGSMANQMGATIDQLLNLVSFCRQVQIPFQVYAFSDNTKRLDFDSDFSKLDLEYQQLANDMGMNNKTAFARGYHLLQFFDSKMSRSDFQKACAITLAIGKFWENRYKQDWKYGYYKVDKKYWLGGTPLNDSIISAHILVNLFQRNNRIDVCNTVFLTDGASHQLSYWNKWNEDRYLSRSVVNSGYWGAKHERITFINPNTKKTYRVQNTNSQYGSLHNEVTKTLLKSLADYTKTNVIGFHILPYRKNSFMNELPDTGADYFQRIQLWNETKKNKFCIIPNNGYTTQFGVLGSDLQTSNGAIEVSEDATKAQIRNAFKKANVGKKESRIMLSKFIDLVA